MNVQTARARYAVEPAPYPVLPVTGSDLLFPVHRIYCVGRNYAAHAVEMGGDPNKDPPFFFQKNPDNLVLDGKFPYPPASKDVHHEIEMVVALKQGGENIPVALKQGGENIPVAKALDCVFGYAVGIDMTRRDIQDQAKELRRPWETSKAFEASAPCGPLFPASAVGHPSAGAIWLDVNGARKQSGDLNQMIWKIPEMISYLSGLFRLAPGDLIFSGTPAGVGPVQRGDALKGHVEGVGEIEVRVG